MKKSMVLVGGILIILGAALGLTNCLIDDEIPMKVLDFFQARISSPFLFLVVMNLFLLAVGCIMGMFSALTVIIPLISPIALAYGIHPVHLGIIFLTNLEIGASIPPLGINLSSPASVLTNPYCSFMLPPSRLSPFFWLGC